MTIETVLRRIERHCRENERAYLAYRPRWRGNKGKVMQGASGEARGMVASSEEIRMLCRKIRREHRSARLAERRKT